MFNDSDIAELMCRDLLAAHAFASGERQKVRNLEVFKARRAKAMEPRGSRALEIRVLRARRKASGLCLLCGDPTRTQRVHCAPCSVRRASWIRVAKASKQAREAKA